MDGRDLGIPVRISDLIWTVRSRSDGAGGKGEEDLTVTRVLAISGEVAALEGTPATLQEFPEAMESMTRCRGARRRR
jgi:hypothetical protein